MDTVYWIWLANHCGAGSESGAYLLSEVGTPEEIYKMDERTLKSISGISEATRKSLCDKDLEFAEKIFENCMRTNVGIMTLDSPVYPDRLKRIRRKPLLLYYKGTLPEIDDSVLIACVGTRTCTEHGFRTAYRLGAELTEAGAIVVSGMALGIDGACARGALSVGGSTIAVLGCGIDIVYPPKHEELRDSIIANGAIITEYAPGSPPDGTHFPVRNRIISGLSLGTCVVEADERSGALITARHAESQGRRVYAFPGGVGERGSRGCNDLIHAGATMVRGARDILDDFAPLYPNTIHPENIKKRKYFVSADELGDEKKSDRIVRPSVSAQKRKSVPVAAQKEEQTPEKKSAPVDGLDLTDVEKAVAKALLDSPMPDEINAAASEILGRRLGMNEVLAALTTLEILGVCRALPGGKYVLS